MFVDESKFAKSVHGDILCVDCHANVDPEDLPHAKNDGKVDCSDCHDTEEFEASIHGKKSVACYECHTKHEIEPAEIFETNRVALCLSCHVQNKVKGYKQSVHFELFMKGKSGPECVDCHGGGGHKIKSAKISEDDLLKLCASCHKKVVGNYEISLHGQAFSRGKYPAPNCITCHSSHKILSHTNPKAKTYVMNVPNLCGQCHKEGTTVSQLNDISEHNILANYKQSIHGDGLFRRGLIVTAVCSSCHTPHKILPHENPESSINKNNIAKTCMQCHAQIEAVHQKVINGVLWEKEPSKIPACIECHQPHEVRRVFYEDSLSDDMCMGCHSNKNLKKNENGKEISLYVDYKEVKRSVHKDNSCIKCHTNVFTGNNPVCIGSGKVDCSICHAEEVKNYSSSIHGTLHKEGDEVAPYCTDCHGSHNIMKHSDRDSPTFSKRIPDLCGQCHKKGAPADLRYKGVEHNIFKNYEMSIHGKGLLKSGLLVTATCTDCHTTHHELPISDPNSSVNPKNIPKTCAKCHLGVYEIFVKSVHSPKVTKTDKKLPVCNDCHMSHTIERVEYADFRQKIINQCGKCHEDVTKTYFDTFHGKVTKLGSEKTAKCSDCHGSHDILPPDSPDSRLSYKNIVQTCKTCHPNSNRKFVGYLTHATHHDKNKYPFLYYTFWFMTILLIGTFSFFGLHTLFWLPRAFIEKRKANKQKKSEKEK
ncbi:MAG: hypothetical protein GXO87_12550 [Chlorobi bacterium]|nr:hypothetical protein [Chlorobiota bacterium]